MDTDVTRLTRDEAIKVVGIKAVERVEALNCEPTSRLLNAGYEGLTEWAATTEIEDGYLTMYYMTNEDDEAEVEDNGGDWGAIDWVNRTVGYEVL